MVHYDSFIRYIKRAFPCLLCIFKAIEGFNDLQIGILIEMSLNMKESKLALILADMKPEKVRELTSILATQNDLMELE
jgi:hypothetical protein